VLLRCHPRNPCSGCFRSMRDTTGGDMARSQRPEHG
jgi:hypothetical protein